MKKQRMTFNDCYNTLISKLQATALDDAAFDSYELIYKVFGLDRGQMLIKGNNELSAQESEKLPQLFELADKRAEGIPLQYLLGEWEFYGLPFKVGKGVLIPRPETELLVDKAVEFLKDKSNPCILDLCAGSGCVGISIGKSLEKMTESFEIYELEKSEAAFEYLLKNIELNACKNIKALSFDILNDDIASKLQSKKADLLVSNPPYIRSKEIPELQREVQEEPRMALDGGDDGLIFYRAIAEKWFPYVKRGGLVLVECGEDQASDIASIFTRYGAKSFKLYDFSRIYRVVGAKIL